MEDLHLVIGLLYISPKLTISSSSLVINSTGTGILDGIDDALLIMNKL